MYKRLAILTALASLTACMKDSEYRAESERRLRQKVAWEAKASEQPKENAREKRLNSASSQIGGKASMGERASGRLATVDVPFTKMSGWIVRGTDESSFVKCGGARDVYFTRIAAEVVGQVVQRYRFKAPSPFVPVYYEFDGRLLDDTVEVGTNRYTRVVEISRLYPEAPEKRPACTAPRRGSLVGEQLLSARP